MGALQQTIPDAVQFINSNKNIKAMIDAHVLVLHILKQHPFVSAGDEKLLSSKQSKH